MNGAIEALLAPDVRPFVIAGAIMIVLAGLEMLTSLIGVSISHVVGKDFDFDGHSGPGLAGMMIWINAGRVPLLILIFLLLGVFSIEGFFVQAIAHGLGASMPTWIASLLALAGTPWVVRLAGRKIARAIPRDETYAINEEDLIGRVGVVTSARSITDCLAEFGSKTLSAIGIARRRAPVPDSTELAIGTSVLLVARDEKGFVAIAAPQELIES